MRFNKLGIITCVTLTTLYVNSMWWPSSTSIAAVLHETLFLILSSLSAFSYVMATMCGPGFLPIEWKPAVRNFLSTCKYIALHSPSPRNDVFILMKYQYNWKNTLVLNCLIPILRGAFIPPHLHVERIFGSDVCSHQHSPLLFSLHTFQWTVTTKCDTETKIECIFAKVSLPGPMFAGPAGPDTHCTALSFLVGALVWEYDLSNKPA